MIDNIPGLSDEDKIHLLKELLKELGYCQRCIETMPCTNCGAGL